MTKTTLISGIVLLALSACNQFKKGDGDLLYKIYEDKPGPTIKAGDFIGLLAIEKTEEDSVTYNSGDYGRASYMHCGGAMFKGDLYSGLDLLSEGDSATLKVNIDSMVKMGRTKPANTKGKYFIYNVRITDVISRGTLSDSLFRKKVNDFMQEKSERWKNEEPLTIKKFISLHKLKPEVTSSGLYYQIIKKGAGSKPEPGDSVDVNYTTMLLSNKIIDSTLPEIVKKPAELNDQRRGGPIRWFSGRESGFCTPGFNEAVMMFPRGTKVRLIMPSRLAYGSEGIQGVPPYMPLIVDIEIVKIIPHKSKNDGIKTE